jgi:TPR repeat protein
VLFFAAAIAGVVVSIPSVRNVVGASFRGNSVSSNPAEQFPKTRLADRQEDVSAKAGQESGNLKESKSRPDQLSAVAPAHSVPVATTRVAPRASDQVRRDFVIRQLDSEELASMRLHADHFIKSGDLSSARLLLERAAEAGDGNAALTLAGTFDPNVLKTLGFQEGAVDIEMARLWYERAERFGSAEARDRLQQLATASGH